MATSEQAILTAQTAHQADYPVLSGSAAEALSELLAGVAEQFAADCCAILMADDRLRVRHSASGRTSNNRQRLMDELEAKLGDWMRIARTLIIIINDPEADPACDTRLSIACKLVLAPIGLSDGTVSGILVIGNSPSARDFTGTATLAIASIAARVAGLIESRFDASTGLMTRREFEMVLDEALDNATLPVARRYRRVP